MIAYRTVYYYQKISAELISDIATTSIVLWDFGEIEVNSYYMVIPSSSFEGNTVVMTELNFKALFVPLLESDLSTCIERKLYDCKQIEDEKHSHDSDINKGGVDWVVVGCGDILACAGPEEAQLEKRQILSPAAFYEQFEIVRGCYLDPTSSNSGSSRHLENVSNSVTYIDMPCSILHAVSTDTTELQPRQIDVPYLASVHRRLFRHPTPVSSPQRSYSSHSHTIEKDAPFPPANPTRRLSQSLRSASASTLLRQRSMNSRKIFDRQGSALTLTTTTDTNETRESSLYSNVGTLTPFDLTDVYTDDSRSNRSDDTRNRRNSKRPESAGSSRSSPAITEGVLNTSESIPSPITQLGSFFESTSQHLRINSSQMNDPSSRLDNKRMNLAWAGYLEKKGGRGMKTSWKKRWFELDKNNLAAGFVYYDCMPAGTKFHRSDNGEWEFAGTADPSALAATVGRGLLGSVPLLCCVIKNIVASNGEAVMSLHQQLIGGTKSSRLGGISRYMGYKHLPPSTTSQKAKSPDRGRPVKRKSLVDVDRSVNSLSPPRSAQPTRRRSSMGGRLVESSSVSPPPSPHTRDMSSDDEESPITEFESMLHMEKAGRTFFINMDGSFGVRGGLEQLLREASIFVTLSVFHGACGYSVRACGHDGQHAAAYREKSAMLVKNCMVFLLNTYGGTVRFIMEQLPSYSGKMSMGMTFEKNQALETRDTHHHQENTQPKLPLHAAAQAMNSAVLSVCIHQH
jgi:hypothetical protein